MHNRNYDATIDYFALLGVHYNACEKTVKQAYRKMARRFHPDVSKIHNATEKFQEISQAYEVLSKHREAYCRDYDSFSRKPHQTNTQKSSTQSTQQQTHRQPNTGSGATYRRRQKPIRGKDRMITYPLTLRYAIRLLKIGYFYIPGLKVKMKFTREAFTDKTFRLKGKGYTGLFGGEAGDFLVKFAIKVESLKWSLKGDDLYGTISVPESLLVPGNQLDLDSPSGTMKIIIPIDYSPNEYIKVQNMGLPADNENSAGHLYTKLIAA